MGIYENVTKASCKFFCGPHSKYFKGRGGMLNWERVKSKVPYACKRGNAQGFLNVAHHCQSKVYTWLRTLGARKKTQINEVYFLAVSQGCSSFAIHY